MKRLINKSTMQLPIVHLNGTSHRELTEGYENAYQSLREAIRAFEAIEFNARDYYPAGQGAWDKARQQRIDARVKLEDVADYLNHHSEHLATLKR